MNNTVIIPTETEDQKAIKNLMLTLFEATDHRDRDAVKRTMADSVYTDYSALGAEAGFASPEEIVSRWQTMLPGFERTVHQPHNFAIWVAGNRATATLGVCLHKGTEFSIAQS